MHSLTLLLPVLLRLLLPCPKALRCRPPSTLLSEPRTAPGTNPATNTSVLAGLLLMLLNGCARVLRVLNASRIQRI